jgi:hypothetical protein
MSKFAILIYEDQARWAAGGPEADQAHKEHMAFNERHRPTGVIYGGEALQPTTSARSIQLDTSVTDGPFVETKEALGGFYLIEADDLDAAVALAQQVPHPFGGLEVRPVTEVM